VFLKRNCLREVFVFYRLNKGVSITSNVFIGRRYYKNSKGRKAMRKFVHICNRLILGFLIFSLGTTLYPLGDCLTIDNKNIRSLTTSDGIVLSGMMGENGWYISDVQITITFGHHWPGDFPYILFKIDNGSWFEYSTPVIVDTDGEHTVWVSCYYPLENQTYYYSEIFKIDKTPPTLTLRKETIGLNQMKIVANASDAMSGVWRVEFYIDDEPVFNDYNAPYETRVLSLKKHYILAFVYDVAGHAEVENITTSCVLSSFQMNFNQINNFFYGFRMTFMESFAVATS
jgi:hypothetical protein